MFIAVAEKCLLAESYAAIINRCCSQPVPLLGSTEPFQNFTGRKLYTENVEIQRFRFTQLAKTASALLQAWVETCYLYRRRFSLLAATGGMIV